MKLNRRGFIASFAAFVGVGPRLPDLEVTAAEINAATGFTPRVVAAPLTTFEQIMGVCLRHYELDGRNLAEVALRFHPGIPDGYDPRCNQIVIMEVHDQSPPIQVGELVGYTSDGRVVAYTTYHESDVGEVRRGT